MGTASAIRPASLVAPLMKGLAALALVLVTALVTYVFTARLNVETAVQQQQSTAVQQFEQSGAQMDANLSQFVDALLDKRGVAEARTAARASISLHAAQAGALKPLAGTGNVEQYVDGLGDLRRLTDAANDRLSAKSMAQHHVNLMAYREKLSSLAKSNVYK